MKQNETEIYYDMNAHPIIGQMIREYGPEFPDLAELFAKAISDSELAALNSQIPDTGRYLKSVKIFEDITSAKSIGILRFEVMIEYIIALSKILDKHPEIKTVMIPKLTEQEKSDLRLIGRRPEEILIAQIIEKYTDHDTAAAGDYLKLAIAKKFPRLRDYVESVHFANTSEDVMGNVFGIIGNRLVYGLFVPRLIDFCRFMINFVHLHETDAPLILPAFTHEQAAEPTTLGKKFAVPLNAMIYLLNKLVVNETHYQFFSGKFGSATGNLSTHFTAYPEINWWEFGSRYVENFNLYYDSLTNQSVSFVVEAQIFTTIASILGQLIKLTDDFIKMARCPGQLFVKRKKKGQKASSIMPGKSNAWAMEGAIKMLKKARVLLFNLAVELPDYPDEGNMGRSYLMRDMGSAFMPIFIALDRIQREMGSYQPNHKKIQAFLDEYPGMSGSVLQTLLKRMRFAGDAYREVQGISINPDGSYANAGEFRAGLSRILIEMHISKSEKTELLDSIDFKNIVKPIHVKLQNDYQAFGVILDNFEILSEPFAFSVNQS